MKKLSALLAAVIVASSLVGCASTPLDHTTGTYIAAEKLSMFSKGKTTREEIAAAIGQPSDKKEVMGKEVWTYPYVKIAAMPFVKNLQESTIFEFDKDGKLLSAYKSGAMPGKSGNPMLDAAGM